MKNILFVFTVPLDYNGIVTSSVELIEKIDKKSFSLFAVSSVRSEPSVKKRLEDAGCKVIKLEYRNRRPLKYYADLKRVVRENGIDVVHAMGNSATLAVEMLAAKRAGVPLRISHSRNTDCKHKFIDKLLRPLFYGACNRRLACGEEAGRWLFGKKPFTVIKNGKEYEKYAFSKEYRAEYRQAFGCGEKTLLVGHVGAFNDQKNHGFIVDVAREMKKRSDEFKFVLIGDGKMKNDIENAFLESGLSDNVVFTGNIKNVNEVLSACDVMILPSLYEGLPGVAVEWQINGLPCLISEKVTKECAISDNVKFLPIDDPSVWAEELSSDQNRVTDEDKIRKDLIECGFDLDENVKKIQAVYENRFGE